MNRRTVIAVTALILGLHQAERAWSFPEMVGKGYNNCLTCHHSPSGGGIVTEYGREL